MKTILTLLLATFLSSTAFAYGEGRLTITLASARNSQIVIDGRSYTSGGDNTVVIDNIRPGNHTVKIYDTRRGRSDSRNDRNNRNGNLIYSANITVRSFQHVDIMINRFGKALVDERDLRNQDDRWDDRYDDDYSNSRTIHATDFNRLINEINSKWFSNQKMQVAKEGIQREYFTTTQVKQLLQLFQADSDKLELAKMAYNKTVDKRNYHTLYGLFSFQSSRDELERYIRDRR